MIGSFVETRSRLSNRGTAVGSFQGLVGSYSWNLSDRGIRHQILLKNKAIKLLKIQGSVP